MNIATKRTAARMILALSLLSLAGCGAVAIEGATVAVDKATVWRNIDDARAGDADAQYAVGNALCCSGDVPEGMLYSTTEALDWLCVAAGQGNADAMVKLAKVFEGDQIDGLRLLRRVAEAPFTTPANPAAAHYWYGRAAHAGVAEAGDTAADLHRDLTPAERAAAAQYAIAPTPPCSWADLVTPISAQGAGRPTAEEAR